MFLGNVTLDKKAKNYFVFSHYFFKPSSRTLFLVPQAQLFFL